MSLLTSAATRFMEGIAALWLAFVLCTTGLAAEAAPLGLYVKDGVLMKDSSAYRGIGANYFSLFSRMLSHPSDTSSLTNLAALAHARIPFVRFMCGGYWPVEQQLYLTNREAYFERLDRVVRCAESNRIGLIPSLFWYFATVPDLVGEHLEALGNTNSQSIAFIRRYTEDLVRRYRDSPAIWGWEFGNEHDLDCDLPNHHRPPVWPDLGTARERNERDELKFAQLRGAFAAFGETVRKFDPKRIILSGNATPRPSAWHLAREQKWTADTEAQFGEMLLRQNPDPMNVVSVHIYHDRKGAYSGGAKTISAAVAVANLHATRAGKPLFLGEFGAERLLGSIEQQQAVFEEFLEAIVRHHVALAAFWVFDLAQQDKQWNVTFENDRAWMLDLVGKTNGRLSGPGAR